jgi:predicted nucleic acid-binding protein
MIVVDASVVATLVGDDGLDGERVRVRVAGERLVAPEIIDLEVVSVLRRLHSKGRVEDDRAEAAIADLQALRIQRLSHRPFLERCWELRENVTVYDAAYIAVAETLDAPLLTADQRLARAPGARCLFELLP